MATYKIIGFDKTNGVLVISFDEKMSPLSVDIPLDEQGLYITGDELDTYIQGFIPTWHLERVNKIAAGIANEASIQALVQAPVITEEVQPELQNTETDAVINEWQQLEAEKQIAKVLVKFGLLKTDSTL